MAEAFLQIVLENLSSLIQNEIGLIMGVDEEMKKLFSTFTSIQAVLEDAGEKKEKNKAIDNWLLKLKDLAFEIEDILDECVIHASKFRLKNSKLSCYSLKNVIFLHNIGRRMKQITEKLNTVASECTKFHLCEIPAMEKTRETDDMRETGSILNESHQVYGRDKDKEKIVHILVNGVSENQHISVLPIIGVGGLGKTTLAQSVYNDERVVEHFEKKLWICVSDNFNLKTLIRAMIESAIGSGSASDLMQLDTLQRRLSELLNQKRYLLVLDDVWNEHQEKWFLLKNVLACGSIGTSIIITTRLKKVADIMGTLPAYSLEGLSEEHCWMLLRQRAFGEEEKDKYPKLEDIGKQIVKKCAGVPMAAKALGGLLRFKRTENEWIYVKESEIWNLPQEETFILPALRLSYQHLPLELRQCFAYFAVFPKDFRIRRKELIFLWMAHGYISSRGVLEVEDVGNEICNELVLRSLFQYDPFDTYAIFMHDLVHDLAQSIMEIKIPGVQVERQLTSTSNTKIRQVNLRKKLVAFPASTQHDMDISSILIRFSRLRVLDASGKTIKDLPSTVANLKHLRFLNLSVSEIRTLPNSLCSLWNLQILNLDYCRKLVTLPRNMRYLKNLRHLSMEECVSLRGMPSKLGELTYLKTLSLFIVGSDKGNQLEEVQFLSLRGKLEIKHLERVGTYMDAKKANLAEKKDLRHLIFEWGILSASESRADIDEKVLDALQPHPNLETLSIRGFSGRCFPDWMVDSVLKKVVRVDLLDCPHCLHLPQLGKLPHLEFLRLQNLSVEYIIEDENAVNTLFPSLKTLELCFLPHLKGVLKEQVSTRVFPNLGKLRIDSCSSLMFSQISSTQEQSLPQEWLRDLKSLTRLSIERSETLTCLPVGWLRHLTALKSVCVYNCPEFIELPEEIKDLEYLELVQIFNVPKMVCLPEALRHTSSLKCLCISGLPQLNSLPDWLEDLSSLSTLQITDCPKLVSLPASIQGMPNLRSLLISECPELERQCKKGTGDNWHKISHIPNLEIG